MIDKTWISIMLALTFTSKLAGYPLASPVWVATIQYPDFTITELSPTSVESKVDEGKCHIVQGSPFNEPKRTRATCSLPDNSDYKEIEWVVDQQKMRSSLLFRYKDDGYAQILNCVTPNELSDSKAWACEATQSISRKGKGLVSPFVSEVPLWRIPNAARFSDAARAPLYRSMNPQIKTDVTEALDLLGIRRVLVFKEIDKKTIPSLEELTFKRLDSLLETPQDKNFENEKIWLTEGGLNIEDDQNVLRVIPFPYRDIQSSDFQERCEQIIEGVQFLQTGAEEGLPTWLHCTVGEDRTGLLAAFYKVLAEEKESLLAFQEDMCEYGYGDGNPQKPDFIVKAVEESLTPLYMEMVRLAKLGEFGTIKHGIHSGGCAKSQPEWKRITIDNHRCAYSTRTFIDPR